MLTCTVAAAVTSSIACGGAEQPASNTPAAGSTPAAIAKPTDTADGPGIITGTAIFQGTAPKPQRLPMDSDPLCKPESEAVSETVLVGSNNGLQNVFVYVKDGLGARTYPVPSEPVVLDQKGCRYIPHVFGIQVGQTLRVVNSDPALHNVNSSPKENKGFNFGQPAGVPAATRVFDRAEIGVPFRCDVHNWMNAYAGIVAHPFYAVTKEDGGFEIKGLPPGTYTVEAWHERLGTQTASVTVDGKTPAKAAFTFAGRPGS